MAAALNRMATSAGERDRWRAAGFINARRFDWGQNADQTLALYQRAVNRRKS
jgi:hypothetical protein